MKRKAHGTYKPRHIKKYVEVASTAQRSDSLAQTINQRFLNQTPDRIAEYCYNIVINKKGGD